MTGGSPWAPSETGPQQTPVYPPPPRPPRRRLPWLLIGGAVVVLIAVITATAAVTYAVARNTNAPNATAPTTTPAAPQFSASDQAAAKQRLCHVFDVSARGRMGTGGMRENGQPNMPILLRAVNGAVAVQNALTPAVPEDVAKAAHRYVDTTLDATTAAMGGPSIDEVNSLINVANDATDALADVCGLPH